MTSTRITFLSLSDPYASQHGGTLRTRGLIGAARTLGAETTVLHPRSALGATLSSAGGSVRRRLMGTIGRVKRSFLPMPTVFGARDPDIARELAESAPDIVVVSALSQTRIAVDSGRPVWLDFMDLWSEFAQRESGSRRGLPRLTSRLQARSLAQLEQRVAERSFFVTCVGWAENEALRRRGIDSQWLPVTLPDAQFRRVERGHSADRPVLGMIGNFHYWPNVDAAQWLFSSWLAPIIEAGWSVLVAGRSSEQFAELAGPDVRVLGEVDSVSDFYSQVDATVAPIRLGGGMKVKVMESFANGVPVVSAPFALEGFPPAAADLAYSWEPGLGAFPSVGALVVPDPEDSVLLPFRESSAEGVLRTMFERVERLS